MINTINSYCHKSKAFIKYILLTNKYSIIYNDTLNTLLGIIFLYFLILMPLKAWRRVLCDKTEDLLNVKLLDGMLEAKVWYRCKA